MRLPSRARVLVMGLAVGVVAAAGCLSFDSLQGGEPIPGDGGGDVDVTDAGDASASDANGGGDAGTDAACPSAHGPTMVLIDDVTPPFCIDSTEVTNAQYRDFLQAGVPTVGQSTVCSGNTSYIPQDPAGTTNLWPLAPSADPYPVGNVDWCDAFAYCKWAGKHLCGGIGGAKVTIADHGDATKSQWYHACSNNGTQQYPFGFSFAANLCNGRDRSDAGSTVPVGSIPACVGGYAGIFDLAGNVEERVDECNDDGGCLSPGGSYVDFGPAVVENCSDTSQRADRNSRSGDIGFRCCAN